MKASLFSFLLLVCSPLLAGNLTLEHAKSLLQSGGLTEKAASSVLFQLEWDRQYFKDQFPAADPGSIPYSSILIGEGKKSHFVDPTGECEWSNWVLNYRKFFKFDSFTWSNEKASVVNEAFKLEWHPQKHSFFRFHKNISKIVIFFSQDSEDLSFLDFRTVSTYPSENNQTQEIYATGLMENDHVLSDLQPFRLRLNPKLQPPCQCSKHQPGHPQKSGSPVALSVET